VPATLPSGLYADASHPLTEGYELLAKEISGAESFRRWSASLERSTFVVMCFPRRLRRDGGPRRTNGSVPDQRVPLAGR